MVTFRNGLMVNHREYLNPQAFMAAMAGDRFWGLGMPHPPRPRMNGVAVDSAQPTALTAAQSRVHRACFHQSPVSDGLLGDLKPVRRIRRGACSSAHCEGRAPQTQLALC